MINIIHSLLTARHPECKLNASTCILFIVKDRMFQSFCLLIVRSAE